MMHWNTVIMIRSGETVEAYTLEPATGRTLRDFAREQQQSKARAMRKQGYRRGYPVALIVGLENDHAVLWQVFSHVVKAHCTVRLDGRRLDGRVCYNFHESVVDALRPALEEGVRSVVVTAPPRTDYAAAFLGHVRKHHPYLIHSKRLNRATFAEFVGSANTRAQVSQLVRTETLQKLIAETTAGEADRVVGALEKYLCGSHSVVKYSLEEIEDIICARDRQGDSRVRFLAITDRFLAEARDKNRVHRLLQISKNRRVRTRVVNAKTSAGLRIDQLGGIVFFTMSTE